MADAYRTYWEHCVKAADIASSIALLQWDQETGMPAAGAERRAGQIATLTGILHKHNTADEFGELLEKLNGKTTLEGKEAANVAQSLKDYRKQKKYPLDFVTSLSRAISESFQAWRQARQENDFGCFEPHLSRLIGLKREECEIIGYKEHPYDALLDEFEPGMTTSQLDGLFHGIQCELHGFVQQILDCEQPDDSFLYDHEYPKTQQWDFSVKVLKNMGYDFGAGRQDHSPHPFTTSFGSRDVRITTRGNAHDLSEMLWCSIHEGGHALYEQGLPFEDYGLPCGAYLTLGIHESQSRLWENNVGRSRPFWAYYFPELKKVFPSQLAEVDADAFYRAINKVKPSLIRVAADELTYHFHIMLRFEVEKALMEKKLEVKALPGFWNEKCREYLGVKVPSDDVGVLQDVHWSHGSIGYFPTYSLGSFYAAQFYRAASGQTGDLEEQIGKGQFSALLAWLRKHIHRHGKRYPAAELCLRATGEELRVGYFLDYVKEKYAEIYKL